jgi:hypothetical protein
LRSRQREFAGSDIKGACNVCLGIGSQCIDQVAMAGKAHAAQIEVGCGDTAGERSYFGIGFCPVDFAANMSSSSVMAGSE